MSLVLSDTLQLIVNEFGVRAGANPAELDEVKVLDAVRGAIKPVAPTTLLYQKWKKGRGKDAPPPLPFDAGSGVFSAHHFATKGKPTEVRNRSWIIPSADKKAKALVGLKFFYDTVYMAIVETVNIKFAVYLWKKADDEGRPIVETCMNRDKYMLVPLTQLNIMTSMWPKPSGKKRADFLRGYNKTEPEIRELPDDSQRKLPVDIRWVLSLGKVTSGGGSKKKVKTENAGEEAEEAEEAEEEEEDRMDVVPPEPRLRAPPPAAVNLLDALAAKFHPAVRILGRTPLYGSDQYHPPTDMKKEFAFLAPIPARETLAATTGFSSLWTNMPLLHPQQAERAVAGLRTGTVETLEQRHAIEDSILLRRPGSNGFFLALAHLEYLMKTHSLSVAAATFQQDVDALAADARCLAALRTHYGVATHQGQEISALVGRGWPLAVEGGRERLAAVVRDGVLEDAIIWLLLHAKYVGAAALHDRSELRRAIVIQDGEEQLAWISLSTPGDGEGKTWVLPSKLRAANVNPGEGTTPAVENWESLSDANREKYAKQIMGTLLPSWGTGKTM